MKKRKYRIYVADFETTVYSGQERTDVWSAAFCELFTDEIVVEKSIFDFFKAIYSINSNIICYFHNLKFDGSFILDYIIRDGYIWHRVPEKEMNNGEYKCSISDRGAWYNIIIKHNNKIIEFRDSLKLLPFTLKKIGEDFKLTHRKTEIEYEGFRYPGCEISKEEMEYIKNDIYVLKEAMEILYNEGHTKLTIGSCCLEEFKKTYDIYTYKEIFPDLTSYKINEKIYGSKNADEYIRKSYKGGYCYLVRGKENKKYSKGWTVDINSSYPSNMHSESGNEYPIGWPTFWEGELPDDIDHYYYFVRLKCRFYIKKGMLPTIQIKNTYLYPSTEYLDTSDIYDFKNNTYSRYYKKDGEIKDSVVELTLTCSDYKLFLEHYDVYDLKILDGCYFEKCLGLFDEYLNKYKKIKENSTGATRELAKLYQNNLYGKFASSKNSSYKIPFINEKNVLAFDVIKENNKTPGYIAVGSAITSYAREFIIKAAQKNYYGVDKDGFIYADTDSCHCSGDYNTMKGINVHPTKYCCWKVEGLWDEAIFVRQKTYIEHITHVNLQKVQPFYNVKCAGMNDEAKNEFLSEHNISEFKEGLELKKMLKAVRYPGGIVLVNRGYKMNKKQTIKIKK